MAHQSCDIYCELEEGVQSDGRAEVEQRSKDEGVPG